MNKQLLQVLLGTIALTLLLIGTGAGGTQANSVALSAQDYVPGEVLVKFRPSVTPVMVDGSVETGVASLDALAREYGVTAVEPLFADIGYSAQGLERIYKLSLPANADVWAAVAAFSADAGVEYAEPNYIYHIMEGPINDLPESMNASSTKRADTFIFPLKPYQVLDYSFGQIVGCEESVPPRRHLGEDARVADVGVIVKAVANGKLIFSGPASGYGYVAVIEHQLPNGDYVVSVYGHLKKTGLIGPGTGWVDINTVIPVDIGDTVGYIDFKPEWQTVHLHFQIRKGPAPVSNGSYIWAYFGYSRGETDCSSTGEDVDFDQEGNYVGGKYTNPSKFIRAYSELYVILDPGHGGNDPGAPPASVAQSCGVPLDVIEKDRTLDISRRVRDILQANGVRVAMTRDDDTNPSLAERTNYINQERPNLAVSIHANSAESCGDGVEAWYSSIGPGGQTNPNTEVSRQLAQRLALKINQTFGLRLRRNNGIEDSLGNLHMVREPVFPSALIEMAFISNQTEALLLRDRPGDFAQAIARAIMEQLGIPSDPYFTSQWGLHNTGQSGGTADADIDAPEAWGVITGTTSVMIAVIDTGVDYKHEDLNDGRVRTDIDKDYVNNDNDAMDDHSHGTHVAGIIAAETNNSVGVAGVMWQAQILPLKVCNSRGSCPADAVASAIRYAADKGADVINMSLGGSCSQTIADAVNYAHFNKGVVVVAAAGNNGGSLIYPAKHDAVIAVGATDKNDKRASFSNYGKELDVVAPGVSIYSTVLNNAYDRMSGTSMASPHVAGVAGLLLSQRPTLTNNQVRDILRQSADDLGQSGFDDQYGYGRVNAYRALQTTAPSNPVAPEQATCPAICGSTAAAENQPDEVSLLSNLRAVRDQVFTQDPGKRWAQIYYEHQLEVAWLVTTDSQLRADVLAGWRAFDPVFRALLDESSPTEFLTPERISAAEHVFMGVAQRGSPTVREVILREWNKVNPNRFVGWDVRQVWKQLRAEESGNNIYLPIITR